MKMNRLPLILALVAALALALSGLGVRAGMWSFPIGFKILGYAAYAGLAASAGALICLAIPKVRSGAIIMLLPTLLLGLAVAYVPWSQLREAKSLPPIHDISTDLTDPPVFQAVLVKRVDAKNSTIYGGEIVAQAQRSGYPDIQPLQLTIPPAAAFLRAVAAAQAMGWEMVAEDPASGRIEATATTLWFGFKDDVVVRVQATATGSKVDVRSLSRVGQSDVGANAARIRKYLAKVAG